MDRNDEAAFEAWAMPRLASLVRFGFALTHDEGGAEDLVESALVRTLLAGREVVAYEDPERYARRMMVHELESTWRGPRATVATAPAQPSRPSIEFATDEAELVERDRVWRELVNVPPRERAVLVLRCYEDRSEHDVAAITGSVDTLEFVEFVEARVHDAVAANVDLMPGPSRIVERAIASARELERRRRRARKLGAGLTVATVAAAVLAIVVASGWRPPS